MTKQKLIEYLDRKLSLIKRMDASYSDMALSFYNQAFGAVEFAGWLTFQDSPETEAEIMKMWNEEYRPQFEKEIWG